MQHAFAGFNEGGKMQDSINSMASENGFQFRPVANFPFDKVRTCRNRKALGMGKIVIDNDTMSRFHEQVCDCTPNIPGTASDECVQRGYLLLCQRNCPVSF